MACGGPDGDAGADGVIKSYSLPNIEEMWWAFPPRLDGRCAGVSPVQYIAAALPPAPLW